jgi:CheY-like chemotaxis protein
VPKLLTSTRSPQGGELLSLLLAQAGEPLSALQALAEQLERSGSAQDKAPAVRALQVEAGRLSALFQMAADLQHPPALAEEPVQLASLLDQVASAWPESASAGGGLVSFDGDRSLPVLADPRVMRRFIEALRRASQGAAPRGFFELAVAARAAEGRVNVAGLARTSGPLAGSGESLDLAYARALAGWLGGALRVAPEADTALSIRFVLDLPLAEAAPFGDEAEAEQQGPRLHVLVVDDNATNRLVAEAFCDMLGFTCEIAQDGVEALEAVKRAAFDLILMDIKMPRMDGLEATRAIRALAGPAALTPIVALTANADAEDVRTYLAAGMQDVVEKPIKAERLAQAIEAATLAVETGAVRAA